MILTDDECRKVYNDAMTLPVRNAVAVMRHIESALLDKLLKGVGVPEPEYLNVQLTTDHEHGYAPIVRHIDAYSADQLLKYGAAQRLAGQQRETCTWAEQDDKDMPGTYESSCGEMWSFIEGGVKENRVTYCHHCGGKVVPASPREQT
jgi:hypothetical protein